MIIFLDVEIDLFYCASSYQKTESVVKTAAEKTTSILGGFGVGFSSKIGQLKNSESFRSFEEKMGTAYENVKVGVCAILSFFGDGQET